MNAFAKTLLAVVVAAVAYLLLWPVPIDPVAWTPPPHPGWQGPYAPNRALAGAERIARGAGEGPEAVAIGADGRLFTGYLDGRIVAIDPDDGSVEVLENTGGRPLGMAFAPDGSLYIADAVRGLLQLDTDGGLRLVADTAGDRRFGFVDDVTVAADGTVYFTDASWKFGVHEVELDFYEHRPHGRVLRHDPATGRTDVIADGLHFANGVALGPGDEYLLVTETARYQVWRIDLRGPEAGRIRPFISNLPGFPDNITFNGRDTFWLALYGPRNEALDALLPRPFLRKIALRLPRALQPLPPRHGIVLGLDLDGRVIHNLQDRGEDAYAPITSAREHDGWLYLGSLSEDAVARIRVPVPAAASAAPVAATSGQADRTP